MSYRPARIVELFKPVEILNPRVTRYSVGKQFSALEINEDSGCVRVTSKATGEKALIGSANVLSAILLKEEEKPTEKVKKEQK